MPDIYHRERQLKTAITKLKTDKRLSLADRTKILDFIEEQGAKGIKPCRLVKSVYVLTRLAGFNPAKSFESATKQDIIKLVGKIEKQGFAEWTKAEMKVILKQFFKWLGGNETYPEQVSWFKFKAPKDSRLPEELLTLDEIKRLIESAKNTRDRAFFSVLYESGCRIGEMLTLSLRNVSVEERIIPSADGRENQRISMAFLIVNGKTGQRRVPLIFSVPQLSKLLNEHPAKNNPDAPLWIGQQSTSKGLSYSMVLKILREGFQRAGIKKRHNPHLFRHSRATSMASDLTEFQLKQIFGWTQGSNMAGRYVHMSGRDVDNAVLKANGYEVNGNHKEEHITVKKCGVCEFDNTVDAQFCERCSKPLDYHTAVNILDAATKEKIELNQKLTELQKAFTYAQNSTTAALKKMRDEMRDDITVEVKAELMRVQTAQNKR